MNHVMALLIKGISSFILLSVIMGWIYGISFGDIFLITVVLGIVSYILGDMFILPRTNNTMATMADLGLAFVVVWWMAANLTTVNNLFFPSLIAAIGVGIFEYFFHKYVDRTIVHDQERDEIGQEGNLRYQTETSEELTDLDNNEDETK
ncbi:Protein of unknown function [Salinibacillus kushneri]|uniref:4 TMS phage holin, superfamily IV n=1 Tax=Salinibacillus kushneri TaxID=237682 RepID=A0A1I0DXA7_9BACI|nr:YndM family protein [Salinibacillus kushneri]SET37172.1 Protein of unknown function [Salinibacillus kushneri]